LAAVQAAKEKIRNGVRQQISAQRLQELIARPPLQSSRNKRPLTRLSIKDDKPVKDWHSTLVAKRRRINEKKR